MELSKYETPDFIKISDEEIAKVEKEYSELESKYLKRKKIFKNMIGTVEDMTNLKR
jgi:hypothetical protein